MNRLLRAACALVCVITASSSLAGAQMTTVTASAIKMGNTPISAGTVTLTPVNTYGAPISLTVGGSLYSPQGFTAVITNGAISSGFQVPDECLASPAVANTQMVYSITIYDNASKSSFVLQNVRGVCGASWSLDSYSPTQSAVASTSGLVSGSSVPSKCKAPSIYYDSNTLSSYVCVGTTYVLQTSVDGSVTLPITTNLYMGDGGGGAADSGISPSSVVTLTGTQTLTGKTIDGVSPTTMSYLDATSSIQTQLAGKQPTMTAASVASLIRQQTGCGTADYVWVPATNSCVAQGGGSGTGSIDPTVNSYISGMQGTGGSDVLPSPIAGVGQLIYANGVWNVRYGLGALTEIASAGSTVAKATQLAAAPTSCPIGQVPTGIDVSGNATGCFAPTTSKYRWSQTAVQSGDTNNAGEGAYLGTAFASAGTVPANTFVVGNTMVLYNAGTYTAPTGPNATQFALNIDSSNLDGSYNPYMTVIATGYSQPSTGWFENKMTCEVRSVGVTGTMWCTLNGFMQDNANSNNGGLRGAKLVTIDTTIPHVFTITLGLGGGTGSTATQNAAYVEVQ